MNKRGTGAIFCLIAAILFATRYIAAAIFVSGVSSWDADLFAAGLEYVGNLPTVMSVIALIIGIIYIVWDETDDKQK